MKNKILLVEDEQDLSLIVTETLCQQGYEVNVAYDGIEGLAKYRSTGADLIIADVMMPRLDGFSMAREIRRDTSCVPIIFLTAKSTIDDVEEGFGAGANDYLRKPFELRELIVRIKALLQNKVNIGSGNKIYTVGKFHFDVTNQLLISGDNEVILSNFETRILELLLTNAGKTVNASELMMSVWQRDDQSNRNSLHGYIHKLRKAFRSDPDINIINQRGFGYMFSIRSQD